MLKSVCGGTNERRLTAEQGWVGRGLAVSKGAGHGDLDGEICDVDFAGARSVTVDAHILALDQVGVRCHLICSDIARVSYESAVKRTDAWPFLSGQERYVDCRLTWAGPLLTAACCVPALHF